MPVSDLVATVVMSDPFLLTVIFEPSTKSAWGLSTVFSHANVDNSEKMNVQIKVTFFRNGKSFTFFPFIVWRRV